MGGKRRGHRTFSRPSIPPIGKLKEEVKIMTGYLIEAITLVIPGTASAGGSAVGTPQG